MRKSKFYKNIDQQIAQCVRCGILKKFSEFSKNSSKPEGIQQECVKCHNERRRLEYKNNKAFNERKAEYRKLHSNKNKTYAKEYREKNKEALKAKRDINKTYKAEVYRIYCQNNKDRIAAKSARRRAYRLKATPSWANKKYINIFYTLAQEAMEKTGASFHVDHIVPLKSDIVCGLHCEHNLQVIPGPENCSKSNVAWPDMP